MTRPWRPGLKWKRSSDHRLYRGGKERERDILAQTAMFISFCEASLILARILHSRPCNNINAGLILGREGGIGDIFFSRGGKGFRRREIPPFLLPHIYDIRSRAVDLWLKTTRMSRSRPVLYTEIRIFVPGLPLSLPH